MVACACYLSYPRNVNKRIMVHANPGNNTRPYLKKMAKGKMTEGMALVVEYLPSKHKSLSSNSSTTK
jgi:hypothetical protein